MSSQTLYECFEELLGERERCYYQAINAPLRRGAMLQPTSDYSYDYSTVLGKEANSYTDYIRIKHTEVTLSTLYPVPRPRHGFCANINRSSSFSLVRPLQAGAGKWAQVWLASVVSGTNPPPSNCLVVIKFFQESLFPIPDLAEYAVGGVRSGDEFAHKEAWAFFALQSLQGTLLPYSFGFFDFKLPCGEEVCGHVMEFVDGDKLQRDYPGMADGTFYSADRVQRRQLLIEKLAHSIHLIHAFGVVHSDLEPRNILVPSMHPDCFVILDWNQAQPAYDPCSVVDSDWGGLRRCLDEIGNADMVASWISQQILLKSAWTEMLGDSSEDIQFRLAHVLRTASGREELIQERGLWPVDDRVANSSQQGDGDSDSEARFPDGAFIAPHTLGLAW